MLSSLFVAAFVSVGLAQPEATPLATRNAEEEAVHKAVDEIVAAIDRNDADTFDRLSTADYTFVNPGGKVWNRETILVLVGSAPG
jgi:hypothetical protein